ncbi:class I SAM-dependent DNA methyltransferase [Jannaschia pohangensis]|uniref:Methyltransferase domain-containing protein n=1 Tax=Jannaschia pohangensis TaxID=390807 RepID=A0A1I3NID4_9RHOB|nr:class I SAM-dependent methyltransferase [Jannaschia pohangensis]SFJ08929.1 Methyltransferase domain-containing protein [Jannaschia pohangensis]
MRVDAASLELGCVAGILCGMATADQQIIGLYRRHAEAWARRRTRLGAEKLWLDRFLGHLPQSPSILDLGCGSGDPVARYFLACGATVTGVDTSPELLAIAAQTVADAEWHIADMRTLDLGTRFDGILAWNSFFHLTPEDQRRMFPIFRRHAATGAVLMFTSGTGHGEVIGQFEGEPLYHGSLDPAEYRALLDRNGFDVMRHVVEDPVCNQQTIWLARLRNAG